MFCINDKQGTKGPTQIFEPGPPVTLLRYCTQRGRPPRMHGPGLWRYEQQEQRVTPVLRTHTRRPIDMMSACLCVFVLYVEVYDCSLKMGDACLSADAAKLPLVSVDKQLTHAELTYVLLLAPFLIPLLFVILALPPARRRRTAPPPALTTATLSMLAFRLPHKGSSIYDVHKKIKVFDPLPLST